MDAYEIIEYISNSKKKTPVKVYLKAKSDIAFEDCQVFGSTDKIIFGEWSQIEPVLEKNKEQIIDIVIENDCRNSAIPMLDLKNINARIATAIFQIRHFLRHLVKNVLTLIKK